MRIAVVSPLFESVPPSLYGGTERVVANLVDQLVARGHDVTLFASGDSRTSARLVAGSPRALRLDPGQPDFLPPTLFMLGEVYKSAKSFDVIHNHADWLAFPFARLTSTVTVTTAHGRLDLPDIHDKYLPSPDLPLISISHDQRSYLPDASWLGTVHNGIDITSYQYRARGGDYLVFLGRICPEKGPEQAIEIAERIGMRLVIAAKVDPVDREYYETVVAPLIEHSSHVEFIGEVNEREKDDLLGNAYAYLFPIDWPEPFGLTMVEAMATGTPVIARRRGSVPEIVQDGVTGFVCESIQDMIVALAKVPSIDRLACRQRVEQYFSAEHMATAYERLYLRAFATAPRSLTRSERDVIWPVPGMAGLAPARGELGGSHLPAVPQQDTTPGIAGVA